MSVPVSRAQSAAAPWDVSRVCDDMSGPNSVGGPCVLPPGHPHVDGIGGQWTATPPRLDPDVLARALHEADCGCGTYDDIEDPRYIDAVRAALSSPGVDTAAPTDEQAIAAVRDAFRNTAWPADIGALHDHLARVALAALATRGVDAAPPADEWAIEAVARALDDLAHPDVQHGKWILAKLARDLRAALAARTPQPAEPAPPATADAIADLVRRMDKAEGERDRYRQMLDVARRSADQRVRDVQAETAHREQGLTNALWRALGREPGTERDLIETLRNLAGRSQPAEPDDDHTSDGRCKYPRTCEANGCTRTAAPQAGGPT